MKQQNLLTLFCKALGIYFFIQAVLNIRDMFFYSIGSQMSDDNGYFFVVLISQLVYLVSNVCIAWYLIMRADVIVSKVMKVSDQDGTGVSASSKQDWIELVIIGVSIFVVLQAIPEMLYKLVNYIHLNPFDRNEKDAFWAVNNNRGDFIFSIFKVVVGIIAITNARLISGRLIRMGDKSDQLENNQ